MTFIIKTDALPSVTNLPKFDFVNVDLTTILTKGSLCLATPTELKAFSGQSFLVSGKGVNLAEDIFRANYAASTYVNLWNDVNSATDIDTYVQMTSIENGLKFTTTGSPTSGKIAILKFISAPNMQAVLTTAKDIYLDVWVTPMQNPTLLGNTAKAWSELSIAKISSDLSPAQTSGTRITPAYVDLTGTDVSWKQRTATVLETHTNTLNEPKFLAVTQNFAAYSAATSSASAVNASLVGQIHATVLEGGYMSQDFVLHSIYMEDLTKSGRTANEVAAIRKLHFDQYFQV